MKVIKVYSCIENEENTLWLQAMGVPAKVFSLESVRDTFDAFPDEKEIKFDIHSSGGSTYEGFAIYDYLRTSGRKIYCDINGSCHSMAVIILLAAPFENRSANRNIKSLIHRVRAGVSGMYTSEELKTISDEIAKEEALILDVYADRTGTDREVLANLMAEEKVRTADELLEFGFISKINPYNTNFKNNKNMSKPTRRVTPENLGTRIQKFLKNAASSFRTVNYDYHDESGDIVFSTESEEDTLAVGDTVIGEDGTYVLDDGRTVTIEGGVVTDIQDAEGDKVEELENRIADLENQLSEASSIINELKNGVVPKFTPPARKTDTTKNRGQAGKSKDELKAEAEAKRRMLTNQSIRK